MHSFDWQDEGGGIFRSAIQGGYAVIVEKRPERGYGAPVGGGWAYTGRLEFVDGSIHQQLPPFDSFEEAEEILGAVLPDFYRAQRNRQGVAGDPLLEAVKATRRKLRRRLSMREQERLDALERWVKGDYDHHFVAGPEPAPVAYVPWEPVDGGWACETPYGRATIREVEAPRESGTIGATSRFEALLVHETGVELRPLEDFFTREEAEAWLEERLQDLEQQPYVDESMLDVLLFSISIYQAMLRDKGDQQLLDMLEELKQRLGESLP